MGKDILFTKLPIGSKFKASVNGPEYIKESDDLKFKQHGRNITLFEHSLVLID